MTWYQWVGVVAMALAVLGAAYDAHINDAELARSAIIVLALMLAINLTRERLEDQRQRAIIDACLGDGNAVRFQGGTYIGCFERTEGSTP